MDSKTNTEASAKFPNLKWAQRKDMIFITIDLPDAKDPVIDLNPVGPVLKFDCTVKEQKYAFTLDLYQEVINEESKWNLKGRNILLNIVKKDKEAEYWPRLMKEKVKNPHISVDWSRWIEEEDEDEPGMNNDLMGDFDPDQMNNFGMGGYGDSDDEEEEEIDQPEEAKADLDDLDDDAEADTAPKTVDAGTSPQPSEAT